MLMRLIALAGIILILALSGVFGCSDGDYAPSGSPVLLDGEIIITNDAEVTIRLVEFTQIRGDLEYHGDMNVRVYSGVRYNLKNRLDPGNSIIFPGGDQIWVKFVANVPDPGNPELPLFENTVDLTVNGNAVIIVKSGGAYDVGPE